MKLALRLTRFLSVHHRHNHYSTCPVTTVLDTLVIIAVKMRPRLKTKSNNILGRLA